MSNLNNVFGDEGFETNSVEPSTGDFELIPAGWYPCEIERAEVKNTKAGTGKYINLMMSIIGDEYANRKVFNIINIQNPNPKCVEIGLRELAGLGIACGLATIGDTDDLIGKQVDVKLKIKKEKDREADNAVCGWRKMGSGGSKSAKKPAAKKPSTEKDDAAGDGEGKPSRPWDKKDKE